MNVKDLLVHALALWNTEVTSKEYDAAFDPATFHSLAGLPQTSMTY